MGMNKMVPFVQQSPPETKYAPQIIQLMLAAIDEKYIHLNTGLPQSLNLILNKSAKRGLVRIWIHVGYN
jgi:hypothetical protein